MILSIDPPPLGYRAQSIDTHISADLVRFHLYRQRTTEERFILGAKYRQSARKLSFECLRQSFPELTAEAFSRKIASAWLQEKCPIDYAPPDKQWRDILGILKVQQEKLDFGYLQQWVERFNLDRDWQRAKVEAGVSHLD
jgi:hypothetical protein